MSDTPEEELWQRAEEVVADWPPPPPEVRDWLRRMLDANSDLD